MGMSPRLGSTPRLTDRQSQCDFHFDYHSSLIKIRKIGMNCFAKPGLTEDLYIVQNEEFSITRYTCEFHTSRKAKYIHKGQTYLLVREDVT
jgi:hypothetical protein